MTKLASTSRKMDRFFKVLDIFLAIGAVCCVVGLGIIAAGFLFNLAPEQIGTGYNSLELGFMEFQLAEGFAPDKKMLLLQTAIEIALTLICLLICKRCIGCIRRILEPMTKGKPFHSTVSINLKKLARLTLVFGITTNLVNAVLFALTARSFDLVNLFVSEKIVHIALNYHFDLTFLVIFAILLLLSHVFHYGEELQQLSDETL